MWPSGELGCGCIGGAGQPCGICIPCVIHICAICACCCCSRCCCSIICCICAACCCAAWAACACACAWSITTCLASSAASTSAPPSAPVRTPGTVGGERGGESCGCGGMAPIGRKWCWAMGAMPGARAMPGAMPGAKACHASSWPYGSADERRMSAPDRALSSASAPKSGMSSSGACGVMCGLRGRVGRRWPSDAVSSSAATAGPVSKSCSLPVAEGRTPATSGCDQTEDGPRRGPLRAASSTRRMASSAVCGPGASSSIDLGGEKLSSIE
mmetsp:Transcript_3295/g.10245  ORF Transcript_3295/g.10245 Transcript_3295/m.10245 type:complete len:271 (-) Transcript_3295:552-1364(-)